MDPGDATCPFCGKTDVRGLRYDFEPLTFPGISAGGPAQTGSTGTILMVRHEDGRECQGTPPSERRMLQ